MKNIPQFVTTNEAYAMLDCGRSHLYDMERLGFIRRAALDQWPTFELTRGYLRYLDSLVDKAQDDFGTRRVLDARVHHQHIKTGQRLDGLCDVQEFGELDRALAQLIIAELQGLCDRQPAESHARLVQLCNGACQRLAGVSRSIAEKYPYSGVDPRDWLKGVT